MEVERTATLASRNRSEAVCWWKVEGGEVTHGWKKGWCIAESFSWFHLGAVESVLGGYEYKIVTQNKNRLIATRTLNPF